MFYVAKSGFVNLRFCENKLYKYIQRKERERERERGREERAYTHLDYLRIKCKNIKLTCRI